MDAIASGRQPVTAGRQMLPTLAIGEAAYRSAEERRSVRLSEIWAWPVTRLADDPGAIFSHPPPGLRRPADGGGLLGVGHRRVAGCGRRPRWRGPRPRSASSSAERAEAIAAACTLENVDLPALWADMANVGYPILPLVRQVTERLPASERGFAPLRRHHAGHHGHRPEPAAGGGHRPSRGAHRGPRRCAGDPGRGACRHRHGRSYAWPAGGAHDVRRQAGHVPAPVRPAASGPGRGQGRLLPGQPARRGGDVGRPRAARRRGPCRDGAPAGTGGAGRSLARHAGRPRRLRRGAVPGPRPCARGWRARSSTSRARRSGR